MMQSHQGEREVKVKRGFAPLRHPLKSRIATGAEIVIINPLLVLPEKY